MQIKKDVYPVLLFNNASVTRSSSQKHLRIILDNQLKFDDHMKMVSGKISKTIGLLLKLQNFFPRAAIITIERFYQIPFDHGDIVYDQAYNMSFHHNLAITRDIARNALPRTRFRGSRQLRRCHRKLEMSYKIFKSKSPQYLFKL